MNKYWLYREIFLSYEGRFTSENRGHAMEIDQQQLNFEIN